MNAVACEVQVTATGARPAEKGGQRELFTEETTTALVFENGGVLRFCAAVVPGQLLFHRQGIQARSRSASDAQARLSSHDLLRRGGIRASPLPDFGASSFPKTRPSLRRCLEKEADGSGQDAEAIFSSEPIAPAHAPSAQEIAMLNEEVEALREQLKLLQAQKTTGSLPAPAEIPDLSRNTAPEPPPAIVNVPAQAPVLAEAHGEPSTKLPTGTAEPAFSEEDLLPKPALDFKAAKPPAKFAPKPEQKVAAASHPAAMRKDLLFAAFVLIVAGAAWYQNLLPGLPLLKSLFSNTAPSSGTHPVAIAPQKTASATAASGKFPQTSVAPAAQSSAASGDASQTAASGAAKPSTPAISETAVETKSAPDSGADSAVVEKREVAAIAEKRSSPRPLSKAAMVSAMPPSDETDIVPPKLIKSVRAVASPNALPDFAANNSENVTFDALVDTSGQIKSMKALSGSPALQSAAMTALKQYQYEPATRHGKPVPAHVTVTVKFLFEP